MVFVLVYVAVLLLHGRMKKCSSCTVVQAVIIV